jgi:hypothetical protein
MPFTKATIMEVQRMGNIGEAWKSSMYFLLTFLLLRAISSCTLSLYSSRPVSRGLPHATMNGPVKAGPYTVPKGQSISGNFDSLCFREKMNGDQMQNALTRRDLLEENGWKRVKSSFLSQWEINRVCPGEGLARAEIFLFFAALIQTF